MNTNNKEDKKLGEKAAKDLTMRNLRRLSFKIKNSCCFSNLAIATCPTTKEGRRKSNDRKVTQRPVRTTGKTIWKKISYKK